MILIIVIITIVVIVVGVRTFNRWTINRVDTQACRYLIVSLNRGHTCIIAYSTIRKCNRIANFIKFTCILLFCACYVGCRIYVADTLRHGISKWPWSSHLTKSHLQSIKKSINTTLYWSHETYSAGYEPTFQKYPFWIPRFASEFTKTHHFVIKKISRIPHHCQFSGDVRSPSSPLWNSLRHHCLPHFAK